MSQNRFYGRPDRDLDAMAITASEVLGSAPSAYSLTAAQVLSLSNASTAFSEALAENEAAQGAAKAATAFKNEKREALVSVLSELGAIMYRSPSVTDDMLLRAQYAVHDDHKSAPSVDKPLSLLAKPDADGSVKLTWSRNGNKQGTIFNIECKGEEGDWMHLATTTKAKITVTGFTPGITKWFRVRATRDGLYSLPSNEEPIYHSPTQPVQLKVAA